MKIPKTPEQLKERKKTRYTLFEGWLYWYTAFGTGALGYLSTEEAYKYVNPYTLFWTKLILESSIGGFNAIKAFRSMTFGRAYNDTNTIPPVTPVPTGDITFFTKPSLPVTQQPDPSWSDKPKTT